MEKVKIKERLENAVEALFDNEKMNGNSSLKYVTNITSLSTSENYLFSENIYKVLNVLRQLFLFVPGAVVLFFLSIALTAFFVLQPTVGEDNHLFLSFFVILPCSALMSILGLGDIRKPKHYVIPLSIIFSGSILGLLTSLFFSFPYFGYFIENYMPYFFPLAFIAPILAKNYADNLSKNDPI